MFHVESVKDRRALAVYPMVLFYFIISWLVITYTPWIMLPLLRILPFYYLLVQYLYNLLLLRRSLPFLLSKFTVPFEVVKLAIFRIRIEDRDLLGGDRPRRRYYFRHSFAPDRFWERKILQSRKVMSLRQKNDKSSSVTSSTRNVGIFHERQKRELCALHALNNVFQHKEFSKGNFNFKMYLLPTKLPWYTPRQ